MFLYFEDNAGVIVNPKGEMKGECHQRTVSRHEHMQDRLLIYHRVAKECADLWPRIASNAGYRRLSGEKERDLTGESHCMQVDS